MAGFGRPPSAAAEDIGSANRGSFRESEELADDADLGLPTLGERMGVIVFEKEDGSRGDGERRRKTSSIILTDG
jgi:hypothetical protein